LLGQLNAFDPMSTLADLQYDMSTIPNFQDIFMNNYSFENFD